MSLLLALLLDALLGEPPSGLHPVVWMGRYLDWAWRRVRGFWSGAFYWTLGAVLFTLPAVLLDLLLRPWAWGWVAFGFLLKPLFSLRMLLEEVAGVEKALAEGLEAGRARLSRLVSRDTQGLEEAEVREAALESLAENLSDSFLAPLFYHALFGLGGAAFYRYANTADAMWGYREHGARGAFAARMDDLLNLLPARLTGLFLWALSPSGPWRTPLARLFQEARKTPSPNAGFPMAALALGLGVRLRKRGVYALNPGAPSPGPEHLWRAVHWVGVLGYGVGLLLALKEG